MLLSLQAGGVGLNLVGANHLFVVDPSYNPQMERQAYDRIRRIGQQKQTYIYRLLTKKTVEERIDNMQKKKEALAGALMGEASNRNIFNLTVDDLIDIFKPYD